MHKIIILLLIIKICFIAANCCAEVTNDSPMLSIDRTDWLAERYTPIRADFSRSTKTADSYASEQWQRLTDEQRGQYILKVSKSVIWARRSHIDPHIIPCLSFKESTFRPQIKAFAENSTAAGLTQVTATTLKDLFVRGDFESSIDHFTHISDGDSYRNAMKKSIIAQIEGAIGVLEQKAKDLRTRDSHSILKAYRGSTNSVNKKYAADILKCRDCVIKNGGNFYQSCIKKGSVR